MAASVSDSDCNELVRFLKDKGLSSIAPQFSEVLGIDKIENLKDLIKEDLMDPCCAFLKPIHKRTLLRNAAECIAVSQSLRDDQLSSAETGSQGSVATSEAESSDESGDQQSSSFDAVSQSTWETLQIFRSTFRALSGTFGTICQIQHLKRRQNCFISIHTNCHIVCWCGCALRKRLFWKN